MRLCTRPVCTRPAARPRPARRGGRELRGGRAGAAAAASASAADAAYGSLSREEAEVLLSPQGRDGMISLVGSAEASKFALVALLTLGGADAACARKWDKDQEACRRVAWVFGCEGALSCGRPLCDVWTPWAPWQWRAPDDPGLRLLPPGEPAPPPPAAAAHAGAGGREPVLRAAACPAEERAAQAGPGRLAERWAAPPRKGGWGAVTPVAAFHREPRLQACLTEAAGAWLPGPLVRALSAPSSRLDAAPLGGGAGGGGGGGADGGGAGLPGGPAGVVPGALDLYDGEWWAAGGGRRPGSRAAPQTRPCLPACLQRGRAARSLERRRAPAPARTHARLAAALDAPPVPAGADAARSRALPSSFTAC
jgi:hypothetical protein